MSAETPTATEVRDRAARMLWDFDQGEVPRERRDAMWADMGGSERDDERVAYELRADMLAAAGLLVTSEPTVVRMHYGDSEAHAAWFNEGFETAVTQGLADDPALAADWLAEREAQVAARALREAADAIDAGDQFACDYFSDIVRARANRIAAGGES
ncbi:hypothetical protein [Cellulomonas denverensis]|uniref:Uncharacterized protein n=1 Tax=Cellulomonas denverensis TaxID=264297 RepID=A0A7X6KU59_9CELL|nr:hypothetical protein [Cellulomonas denverensis]NKY22203.1 hypothetical protein [Cellulomonas denverensis]GIG27167.1 hypothetical protein Cde04nite_34110 [Cellulomonas denverensis]